MEEVLSSTIETSNLSFSASGDRSEAEYFGVSTQTWARVFVVAVLFAAVFWPNLRRLWLKTNPFTGEANWSHSIFVPIIGLYYLFVNREELIKAGSSDFIWGKFFRPGRLIVAIAMAAIGACVWFGSLTSSGMVFSMVLVLGKAMVALGGLVLLLDWSLAIIFFGLGVYVYGIYPGQNDYLKDLGMVITLFGIVLMLNGWKSMKIAWFPVAFLTCAIPWPGLVYSWIAEPLSHMAAHFAVLVLKISGVDGQWSGSKIIIHGQIGQPPRVLNVEEACAGMKSLMTFIAVAGAIAFLSIRPLWQRIIIVVSAVPIAIFCNMMRISVTGLLDHYVSTKWSDSFAHQFVGIIMLLPAFFLILMVAAILEKIFIIEADDEQDVIKRAVVATSGSPAAAVVRKPAVVPQKPLIANSAAAVAKPALAAPVRAAPTSTPRPAIVPPRPAGSPVSTRPLTAPGAAGVNASPSNRAAAPVNKPAVPTPPPVTRAVGAVPPRKPPAPAAYKPVDITATTRGGAAPPHNPPSTTEDSK